MKMIFAYRHHRLAFYLEIFCVCLVCMLSYAQDGNDVVATLRENFAEPDPLYSPVPIWWWSGDPVTKEGISTQLQRLAEGGIHNAIVLNLAPSGPLYGSAADDPPFLSERWWELFAHALEEGKRYGVRLWFYDQLGFSGAGLQARVVRDHPEYRGLDLDVYRRDIVGPTEETWTVPPGGTLLAAFVARRVNGTPAPASKVPYWVWQKDTAMSPGICYFRKRVSLPEVPAAARIEITCDNAYVLYVNGTKVGEEHVAGRAGWGRAESYDVTPYLRSGANVVAIQAENFVGNAGLLFQLIAGKDRWVSDETVKVSPTLKSDWMQPTFDDDEWEPAFRVCPALDEPWGSIEGLSLPDSPSQVEVVREVREIPTEGVVGKVMFRVGPGNYRFYGFFTRPGGFDYHNPEACAALLDLVHGEMERRFGDELGKQIAGSFQDEFPALPRYSSRFVDEFSKRCGYDLRPWLPALYDEVESPPEWREKLGGTPLSAQVRADAARVASSLCEEAFFIPLEQWHERYGMLCGYDQTVRNADPLRGEKYYIDYFRAMRHYSAPGNDMDGDVKPHQSIAVLYNKPRVWLEAFHSSGWGQTLEEIAFLLHPWFVNGATLYDPHAVYYSIHGSYWEWAPPDTGWRQPYFVHFKALADYTARLCGLLSRGDLIVDTALVHPTTTMHVYSGFGADRAEAQRVNQAYWKIQETLRQRGKDYLILDEPSLARAEVVQGRLIIGRAQFRSVLLPGTRFLPAEVVKKLAVFAEEGGAVLALPAFPEHIIYDLRATDAGAAVGLTQLQQKMQQFETPEALVNALLSDVPQTTEPPLPALHRRIGDRDFFFINSDTETRATGQARFEINERALYDTPAAKGAWLRVTLPVEGMPEVWDAVHGRVAPLWNFERGAGKTTIEVPLEYSPAPLIAIRPAKPHEPQRVSTNFDVYDVRVEPEAVHIEGYPRLDRTVPYPDRFVAEVEIGGRHVAHKRKAVPVSVDIVPEPFAMAYLPTADNTDGSFAWPPSPGCIPVETRIFRAHPESNVDNTAEWTSPKYDDSTWELVLTSYGPRAQWAGPIDSLEEADFDAVHALPEEPSVWNPAVYSLRLGIPEDPVFSSALGGKGRIPEEFIDLGPVSANAVYWIRAYVEVPGDVEGIEVDLRYGGTSTVKRAFLDGKPVAANRDGTARVLTREVTLTPGLHRLDFLVKRLKTGRLRFFYHFVPKGESIPTPEWVWSPSPSPTGKTVFRRLFHVPGPVQSAEMVLALGTVYELRINGHRIAEQGNFDPYFTSRAEHYEFARFLREGKNTLEVIAADSGPAVGMLLDAHIQTQQGEDLWLVSDSEFTCRPADGDSGRFHRVRVLPEPAHAYMGDPALLLLEPRRHPLPSAGWLVGQPNLPAPLNAFRYMQSPETPPAFWYRFLLPPGATRAYIPTSLPCRLWVNGVEATMRKEETRYAADLVDAQSPHRLAALRIECTPDKVAGAALDAPITYDVGDGTIMLGSWDTLGLPHYAGGIAYHWNSGVALAEGSRVVVDLGRVRGSVELHVNGESVGTRLWHPYRFDVTAHVHEGENMFEARVFNTLGPHFAEGHPSAHVFKNHTVSGIFGPVQILVLPRIEMRLSLD